MSLDHIDPTVDRAQARQVAAQLFQVDETAINLTKGEGTCWLRVAIPHQPEQLAFRGTTWFSALEAAMKFLVACVVVNPEGAAQAAAAAKFPIEPEDEESLRLATLSGGGSLS